MMAAVVELYFRTWIFTCSCNAADLRISSSPCPTSERMCTVSFKVLIHGAVQGIELACLVASPATSCLFAK